MSETPWIVEFFLENGWRITGTTSDKLPFTPFLPRENETIHWKKKTYRIAHVQYNLDERRCKFYCKEE